MHRNPLDKESFLKGNRQRWFLILLGCAGIILICDTRADIDATAYLNFLTITGSVFLLGASADSFLKIKKTDRRDRNNYEHNEEREPYYDP